MVKYKSRHGLCWKDQVTLKSCVSHTGSAHLWSLIRWLAWSKIAWLWYIQYCLRIENFRWFEKLQIAWPKYSILIRWLAWLKIAWLRYIQYCLDIENFGWFEKLKIAWLKYIQYCLKEMLDIENRLASKTVPRNVKDFPTLWNKIMLMIVLATMIIGVMITRTKQWSWPLIMVIRTLAKLW